MKLLLVALFFFSLLNVSAQTIQEADLSIPILVYDNSGNPNCSRLLYCGIDSLATDSIDSFLGENWLYCPWDFPGYETDCIPYDHFEAVLDPPVNPDPLSFFFGTWKDFRHGELPYSGTITYKIVCGAYDIATAIYIAWDFPKGVAGILQDPFGGAIFSYQMPDSGSFTHPALMQLGTIGVNLILSYQNVVPVELISFTANVSDNSVNLSWQTATETNNSGFQIERRKTQDERSVEWITIGFVSGNGTTTEPQSYSFVDENLSSGKYKYRLKQIDYDGSYEYSSEVELEINPKEFALEQNFPNPFNPSTTISWQSPVGSHQTLKVFDVLGNEIATLVNEYKPAGSYQVGFDATRLSSGVYYYKLNSGDFIQTKKMIFIK